MITILIILFVHFVADFILQTDKMALNKSSSNKWLTMHVLAYSASIAFLSIFIFKPWPALIWVLINGSLHWVQDYATSRFNASLWKANKRHEFFVAIGADQYLHFLFLLISYDLLN